MSSLTPDQIAAKWSQNLGAAGPQIAAGVQSVKVAPGAAAAAQKQVWVQNTTSAANKWAANTAKVTKEEWQAAMINKGVPRIASGAAAAQPNFTQFMAKLLPYIDQQVSVLPARGDLEQNIQRAAAFARGMSKFSK